MSRSPIEIMIDQATGYTGPSHKLEWITLCCPDCNKEMRVQKDENDPPTAIVALIPCPQCWNENSEVKYLYKIRGVDAD